MTFSLLWSVRLKSPDVLFSNMTPELLDFYINITNYFSPLLIKSKKYNALSVRLIARILHIKQQQNTITILFFLYTVFMFCYIYYTYINNVAVATLAILYFNFLYIY